MPVSERQFLRWTSRSVSSWPFQVYQKYNAELSQMFISQQVAQEYVYRELSKSGTRWQDHPTTKFPFSFENGMYSENFKTIKLWSDYYGKFENWNNLNTLVAMSSNLETFMSSVIKLALESDLGILSGASRRIDGILLLKYGRDNPFNFDDELISCTRGDWQSRISSFIKIFGEAPDDLENCISILEKVRKIRNNVGHAFGRDIEKSREHDNVHILEIDRLSRESIIDLMKVHNRIAKSIDRQLMENNIGEYQALHFYHNNRDDFHADTSNPQRLGMHIVELKKKIGSYSGNAVGKLFCKGLIEYYINL
ncbi:hypothetical protein ABMA67_02440 [Halobacteriovorax sp. RZ-3]|uniref:hypothetical protein n=1 Tax=Halobacteriovorax sp. RZ-3 TaxID=3157720 RepID=UPI003713BA88